MRNFTVRFKHYLSKIIIHILNLLPIKNNKVFIFCYYGSQYGDSPKYITEHIITHSSKGKFDVVWAFNDLTSRKHLTGFRKVKTMTLRYFYDLCTSKVIITNFRTTELFVKRKHQYYIQTWHSSLRLKQIEKDAEGNLPKAYIEMAKKDSEKCDLLLSGCKRSTEIFQRAFWYDGEIFEHGTPRLDLFFREQTSLRESILEKLNIPQHYRLVLYAPTFRKNHDLEIYNLDYSNVLNALNQKFGGEWVFLVKLHPHLITKAQEMPFHSQVMNVTAYDDLQELLSISDVLISDYSSLMFDFSFTRRPCFLYVPDIEDYTKNERSLYFDLKELPFISAFSNIHLQQEIECFNLKNYQSDIDTFLDYIGSHESGHACESLFKRIEEVCFQNQDKFNKVVTYS